MAIPGYYPPGGGPAAPRVNTGGYLHGRGLRRAAPVPRPEPAGPAERPYGRQQFAPVPTGPPVNPYQQALQGDPGYMQGHADVLAAHLADQAARNEQLNAALIQFGEVPAGAKLPPGYTVDDATGQLINSATAAGLSTQARLQNADRLAQAQINQQLAGRGIAYSGDTPFRLGQEQLTYRQQQFDARNQLLQTLAGLQGTYAQNEQARQQQLYQLGQSAFNRQLALWRLTGGRPQAPVPVAGVPHGGPL